MADKKDFKKRENAPRRGPGSPVGGMIPEKPKDFSGTLKRLLGYLKPMKVRLIVVFVMGILATLFNTLSPVIMGMSTTSIFDSIKESRAIDYDYILKILTLLTGLYFFGSFFQYLQSYIMVLVSQRTVFDLRKDLNLKLGKLPLKYFDTKTYGEILSRVTNDIDTVSGTLQQTITQFVTSIVTLLGIVIIMLTISPILTLVVFVTLPLSFLVTKNIAKKSHKYFKKQQNKLGDLNGHIEEMYTGHNIVKAFSYEEESIKKFEDTNEKLYDAGWKAQFVSGLIMPIMNFIGNIGYVFVCVIGGIMVSRGTITIGNVQAFIQYTRRFTQPIIQLANIANVIQSTIAAAERVFDVLDQNEEEKVKDPIQIKNVNGDVLLKDVKFGYDEDKVIIKNMDIDVKKGQTIAIVGPTGAGKTTIVNLLMRFYDIWEGDIKVDGINIHDMKRKDLRNIFGMVLQDTWLFNGTIKDNIAYGKENATFQEVKEAAKAAYAHHFILTLPNGYDTVLNEEASNISQGQKQLITIARAILADHKVLILDEATSSVDTRTEQHIQNAMLRLMKGRTSFVIAHRLSTIKDADCILVIDEGEIIEKGTHVELLKQKGFYSEMYLSQFTTKTAG